MSLLSRWKRQVVYCLGLQSPWLFLSGFVTLILGMVQSSYHGEDPSVWGYLLFSWKFASGVSVLGGARGSSEVVCSTAVSLPRDWC